MSESYKPEGLAKASVNCDAKQFVVEELPLPADLRAHVQGIWGTTWALRNGERMVAPAVPNGCVSLMLEENPQYGNLIAAKIVGPMRAMFPWTVAGTGFSLGVTFR